MRWLLHYLVVSFVSMQCVCAQSVKPSKVRQPRTLQITTTRVLSVPVFGFWDSPLYDDSGNLYMEPSGGGDSAIFKLSQPDEGNSQMITLPSGNSGPDALIDYAVTPSGGLYALAQDEKQQFHVYSFFSDGSVKHNSKFEISDDLILINFAVFDDESMLVAGYYSREAQQETLRGKSYLGIFNQSGQLLTDLTAKGSLEAATAEAGGSLNSVHIRPYRDGNLYLLKPSSILVISPGGGIVRRITFTKPDPSTVPMGLYVADGLVAIRLTDKPEQGRDLHARYLIVDASTGKEYGYYVPSADLKGRLVRFSREEGFVFVSDDKKNLLLISAKLN